MLLVRSCRVCPRALKAQARSMCRCPDKFWPQVAAGEPSHMRSPVMQCPWPGVGGRAALPEETRGSSVHRMSRIHWKTAPDEHDFPAALAYLELLLLPATAQQLVAALREAPDLTKKSKDLLRASGLDALHGTNPHVAKDIHKIRTDTPLSPVLLVRGDARDARPLVVADGYHRICAVHIIDEDAEIHCRIVDIGS